MTTSVFLTNMAWVFLFVNWVTEWRWKEKFSGFRQNYALHAFLALAGVGLVWSIGTRDLEYTLYTLQVGLPLLVIPLVLLTTPALSRREALAVGACYVGAVLAMTGVGVARRLTVADLPYRDIVPHISHIRFGLNLCFCIALIVIDPFRLSSAWRYARVAGMAVVLWFLAFLLVIHAYTAIIVLLVLVLVMPLVYWKRLSRKVRWLSLSVAVAVWAIVVGSTVFYHNEYYTLRPPSSDAVRPALTAGGNPYLHRQDGLVENGNYVHQYVCEKEMREQWVRMSSYPFDSLTDVGYTIYPALLRYLNAIGATKDSLGMTRLQPDDVAAIERGVANPVYLSPGPRKLFYVLFYEYENYRCYRSVSNFSTLQRLELWRAGWTMHTRLPLTGYGTGGIRHALQMELVKSQSPLAGSGLHLHNQYLTFLVAFGWLGLAIVAFFFLRAIVRGKPCRNSLFTAHLIIVLISFMADNTLDTLAGITFAIVPFCLLYPRPKR